MSNFRRVVWIVSLTLSVIITGFAVGWVGQWLELVFNEAAHIDFLVAALQDTVHTGMWLVPLLFIPRLRDIGSLRLSWSSTIFLLLPPIALNLFFFGPTEQDGILFIYWVWWAMATAAFEELVFRGYAFRNGSESQPHLVILVSATCFALAHLSNLTRDSLDQVFWTLPFHFVLGLALSIVRLASGSLAWCIVLHALLDASANFSVTGPGFQTFLPLAFLVMMIASIYTFCFHPKLRRAAVLSSTLTKDAQAESAMTSQVRPIVEDTP